MEGQHGTLESTLNLKTLGLGWMVLWAGRLSWQMWETADGYDKKPKSRGLWVFRIFEQLLRAAFNKPDRGRQILHDLTEMWNITNKHKKNSLFFTKEWDEALLYSIIPRVNRMIRCTLKYVKRIDLVKFSYYTHKKNTRKFGEVMDGYI